MIRTIETYKFIEEEVGTNSAPMRFLCNLDEVFYLKYIHAPNEYDLLVYELVCAMLCEYVNIKTAEVALVKVVENTYAPDELYRNTEYFVPGITAFGSKYIEFTYSLTREIDTVNDRAAFRLLNSPMDLVLIGMFDLYTDNRDRWEENYNLLLKKGTKTDFYAIDHSACFCGPMNLGKFNPGIAFNINQSIFKSPFFLQTMRFLSFEDICAVIDNFVYLCSQIPHIQSIIADVFAYIPPEWQLSAGLHDRIVLFLSDMGRLNAIQQQVKDFILYQKRTT